MSYTLVIPQHIKDKLWEHLIGNESIYEEAAFLFVKEDPQQNDVVFNVIDWEPVPEEGFAFRSDYHIELADETITHVIKKAHDLQAFLVECHSHVGQMSTRFSVSDFWGFKEFVPYVLWRLKGTKYIAVVVNTNGEFDGLVWTSKEMPPGQLHFIRTKTGALKATGLSLLRKEELDD